MYNTLPDPAPQTTVARTDCQEKYSTRLSRKDGPGAVVASGVEVAAATYVKATRKALTSGIFDGVVEDG